jgi:hypothetical protein
VIVIRRAVGERGAEAWPEEAMPSVDRHSDMVLGAWRAHFQERRGKDLSRLLLESFLGGQ